MTGRSLLNIAVAISLSVITMPREGIADETSDESGFSTSSTDTADRLIRQLAGSSFIQRDWAARQLMSCGPSIVPRLEAAVQHDPVGEPALALLTRLSESRNSVMAAAAARSIASLREKSPKLPPEISRSVEAAYQNSIRDCLAQLVVLGAVITRDSEQQVTHLQVKSDSFDDRHLRLLPSLTTLLSLDLRDTRITDAGLRNLSPLTGLVRLNLSDTQVTGSGLRELKALPNLKHVIAYRIDVTPADREWLREHLPGTTITDR